MNLWICLVTMCTTCIGAFITSIIINRKRAGDKFGWIAPDGRLFECGANGHRTLASQLVGELHPSPNPEKSLMSRGWVKYSKTYDKQTKRPCFTIGTGENRELTDAQIEVLERLGFDRLLDFSSCQFEKQLIQECREDGMTDEEISRWMKEI